MARVSIGHGSPNPQFAIWILFLLTALFSQERGSLAFKGEYLCKLIVVLVCRQ
jgi:hypothetical protein